MPSWCTNWWCDQWRTGVNFILAIPAHFCILVNTGQGIGTEPCLLDTMFPLDHSNFDSGAESSRFTIPYTIRISMHLHTHCSSRWIEICIVIIFYEILVWFDWRRDFVCSHTLQVHTHFRLGYIEENVWSLKKELLHPIRFCGTCFELYVLLVVDITFHNWLTDKCFRYLVFIYWCVSNYTPHRDVSVVKLSL